MSKTGMCTGKNEKQKVKLHKKNRQYFVNEITQTLSV